MPSTSGALRTSSCRYSLVRYPSFFTEGDVSLHDKYNASVQIGEAFKAFVMMNKPTHVSGKKGSGGLLAPKPAPMIKTTVNMG